METLWEDFKYAVYLDRISPHNEVCRESTRGQVGEKVKDRIAHLIFGGCKIELVQKALPTKKKENTLNYLKRVKDNYNHSTAIYKEIESFLQPYKTQSELAAEQMGGG